MTFRKQPYIVVVLKVIQANGAFKCGFSDFEFFHGGVDEDRALVDDWADESAVQRQTETKNTKTQPTTVNNFTSDGGSAIVPGCASAQYEWNTSTIRKTNWAHSIFQQEFSNRSILKEKKNTHTPKGGLKPRVQIFML